MMTACAQCGGEVAPPPAGHYGGRPKRFCSPACSGLYHYAAKESRRKALEPVDRKAFAGSACEFAARDREIQRDPELRRARARLSIFPANRLTIDQRVAEMRATRRRQA